MLLIDDLEIRVVETDTGGLFRQLTLHPNIGCQPRLKNNETLEPQVRGFPMS